MPRRPLAAALAGTLAAGLLGGLAGCGGSDDGAGNRTPAPSPTPAPVTDTSTTGVDPSGDPAAYLPVPEGRELTPPGTALRLGRTATAAWVPRQGVVGVVEVRVDKIEQTTVARSLAGFTLDAAARASTPYFVSTTVDHVGDAALGGRQLPLYVVDDSGRLVAPTGVAQDFEACPGSVLPAGFGPGDRARSCLIFLVPSGASLASVIFRPADGVDPITWTGRVRRVAAS